MSDKLCRIRWGQVRRGLALCLLGVWQSGFNFIDPGHVPSARVAGQTALGAERAKNVPRWLSELQDEGLIEEPDANMCVVLACDAAKRNDWSAGEQWLRRAWGNSSTPDASSVKMLWEVVGQYVPLSVAERWLSLTAVAPQMPYVATALLRAASRGCDLDTAEKWFQAMQSSDPALAVDQSLCLRLLSCSLQSGNTSLAEEWIKRAVKAGAKTSEITMRIMKDSAARRAFEAMIRQTAEATDLAAARRWYDQAVAAGLYPSPRTFAALLEAALNADDSTAADYWYQGVVATPGQPAVVSFNLLLDVAARKGRVKLLRQWFSKMQELVIEPNPETFRTLIMGTVKSAEGDLETAESWYQQALEAGFRLSAGGNGP